MNFETARINMLKQQIRVMGITDDPLLEVINSTPRELFVPRAYQNLAYMDRSIPIGHRQVMLTPTNESQLLEALDIQPSELLLEVGTGTGYLTSLLAKLCHHVTSCDIYPDFIAHARRQLSMQSIDNVSLTTADITKVIQDLPEADVIVMTSSMHSIPEIYRKQLNPDGRMIAILGEVPDQYAVLARQTKAGWKEQRLFHTDLPRLINAPLETSFTF